jgi:thiamine pyrophosphate-dependent acetolactate synthase large subunit-like protein
MREIVDADMQEATLLEQFDVVSGIPNGDVAFNLPEHAATPESLHEVLGIRRVQIERPTRFQGAVNRAADADELVVIDVLGEVERETGVEAIQVLCTE